MSTWGSHFPDVWAAGPKHVDARRRVGHQAPLCTLDSKYLEVIEQSCSCFERDGYLEVQYRVMRYTLLIWTPFAGQPYVVMYVTCVFLLQSAVYGVPAMCC